LDRLLGKRLETVEKGEGIDWAAAEALSLASLLVDGIAVRLSGQDSARGTFSQRHSVLVDTKTGRFYTPLNHLSDNQAPYSVYNSPLAEASVMGFEYGYAITRPDALVLWEAQFGDFANNAQAIIDLFIASGEVKWQRLCGLALLLPHGMEGLGPEHSSARLERFLQLCAGDNMQVCYPTTPAQYFHLLRRQVKRPMRKPLVVMTPKSLLRHPLAVSTLDEMAAGSFMEVLDDAAGIQNPKRLLLCSGKIYYALLQWRQTVKREDVAIVRLEQLYPFPAAQLQALAAEYRQTQEVFWVQEEPENMGAWQFVRYRLEDLFERAPAYVGRPAAASPATGFPAVYKQQQTLIVERAIGAEQNGQVS
jgi:2-oxoglutarate dehydrogenase E1 component